MRPSLSRAIVWIMVTGVASAHELTYVSQEPASPDRPIVGAIRWDAWYGQGTPVSEVEKTLGPRKYHFRLPFFAQVISPGEVSINGDQLAVMESEISYAADAGLDYWAFVDYWDQGNLGIALRRYREAHNKRGIHYCLIEEGGRLDQYGTKGWPRLVAHFQDPNYQKVLDGKPLLFVYGVPKTITRADFDELDQQTTAAGLSKPYKVLMGWNPRSDKVEMKKLGFDAVSAYAAGVGYEWEQWPYDRLTEHVRTAYWGVCRSERLETITFVSAGWDPRPRVEHPTPWIKVTPRPDLTPPAQQQPLVDAVTATPDQLAQHLRDALDWTKQNRDLNRANAIIIYGWNENDEGGWLIPTLQSDGKINKSRIDALSHVLRRPTADSTDTTVTDKGDDR